MPVVTAARLRVSRKQRVELERMARSSSLPHRCVVQASALLLAADGTPNAVIARACSTTPDTVRRWCGAGKQIINSRPKFLLADYYNGRPSSKYSPGLLVAFTVLARKLL